MIDRDALIRAIITAPVDWEGNNTGTWDRGASVADAVIAHLEGVGCASIPPVEYGHGYTDQDGRKHVVRVDKSEYDQHEPSGHRADGSPYWNYTQKRRRKAGPWEPVEGNDCLCYGADGFTEPKCPACLADSGERVLPAGDTSERSE